jgi:hypothetical protein
MSNLIVALPSSAMTSEPSRQPLTSSRPSVFCSGSRSVFICYNKSLLYYCNGQKRQSCGGKKPQSCSVCEKERERERASERERERERDQKARELIVIVLMYLLLYKCGVFCKCKLLLANSRLGEAHFLITSPYLPSSRDLLWGRGTLR